MALYSMTGFGRAEEENDNYVVTVEIKSVNHRFKDCRFKMSSLFNGIELDLKKILFKEHKRGSFDVYVNFKRAESNSKFDDIDANKVEAYLEKVRSWVGENSLNIQPTEFLRNEFLADVDLSKDPELMELTLKAFEAAVKKLKESRSHEGAKLQKVIEEHRDEYQSYFSKIENLSSAFQKGVEDKLRKRFDEYKDEIKVDEPRFMQEVIFYLEKLDVHEEINRIKSHLQKLNELIDKGGECGREIDFLVQELNRETNTIGSKSAVQDISNNVVQMKVQLEKIREQGLNLE
jgi:uncharacterized protein (TIGR00255 family)